METIGVEKQVASIPLWLEVNLAGEEFPNAGKVTAAGASAYRRAMHLCKGLNSG